MLTNENKKDLFSLDEELKRIALRYLDLYQSKNMKIEINVLRENERVKITCSDFRS